MDCIGNAIATTNSTEMRAVMKAVSPGTDCAQGDGLEMEPVDPCSDPAWDQEALAHPESTVFHSGAWARVLARTYGHRARYFRFSRSGELAALLPLMELRSRFKGNRGVCLPFTDFCEPLIFDESTGAALGERIADLARDRKWKYFEIRGNRVAPASAKPAVAFYGHSVKLGGTEDLFASVHASVRRAIRKAEQSALEVRVTRTRAAMLEYYRLHAQTRRRHGLPPQPVSFFLNIQEQIMEKGLGFISLVLSGSIGVAAAMFFHQGTTGIYKFGASDRSFQALRPNNLAMWNGMKFLAESGIKILHMGRTSLQNEGLRRFKLGWGASESMIEYFKFNTATQSWLASADQAAGFHNAIFSKLPLSINRLMGTLIYPHLD
jgi:hypothetical protein